MDEFGLIQRYFSGLQQLADGVVLGIGDDAAVLEIPPHEQLVVTTDTLVEGVHFPADIAAEHVASRALGSNLSDLAAMGAEPRWFSLALTLPQVDADWLAGFSQGLAQLSRTHRCALVGGDTTRGPLSVTITVHGTVPRNKALTRCGACPGDRLFVSGVPGMGAAGLACLQGDWDVADSGARQQLLNRFLKPEPRLQLGLKLRGIASAAIDISDGLLADLGHICQRSGVGAQLDIKALEALPWPETLNTEKRLLRWTLAGGDDYELCFAVPEKNLDALSALQSELAITAIGEVMEGEGLWTIDGNGQRTELSASGYQHF
ncbi:thiamine-phosphate kinase [Porticoccus sp. W117]|uniref:thiamine-phosphate kinase n=1 Tax=Porticoccus sp. W117 TaxID=3054777 RepID=UPI002598B0C0|nr:thiamine-phosphate kinase [Porticoccus sp. W117]MDM3872071.1 thiamine-phosphate kinase [Porticoccus sp. W117]